MDNQTTIPVSLKTDILQRLYKIRGKDFPDADLIGKDRSALFRVIKNKAGSKVYRRRVLPVFGARRLCAYQLGFFLHVNNDPPSNYRQTYGMIV